MDVDTHMKYFIEDTKQDSLICISLDIKPPTKESLSVGSLFKDTQHKFIVVLPRSETPLGSKDVRISTLYNKLKPQLKQLNALAVYTLHQCLEGTRRFRTITEVVPSQGDRSHSGHLESRSRTISEGEDTAISGRFQSYKRGFLVELPAGASVDQRIEIEDAIKKHDFIETSMFYENMHWKLDVKGGPPVYVYFRNTTKSTVEPVNSLQETNKLVELPAGASVDQRIEIEDAIKKHDFIETSMFYENMHWKLDVKGGPPVYVYFRNTTKSTVEPVNSLQSTNQSIPKDRSFVHPVFRHPSYNNVFHSLQEGIMSLNNCSDDNLKQLNTLADQCKTNLKSQQSEPTHPFILVEGLDASGKTTVTDYISKKFNATSLYSPPHNMKQLRATFDKMLSPLKTRLFYTVANYCVGIEAAKKCRSGAVIMDRFWPSTAAYTIATDCGVGDENLLPPPGDPIYKWPIDLVKPSLVLLLTIDEQERERRMKKREASEGCGRTPEEQRLSQDTLFQRRVLAAYKRIHGVKIREIDTGCSRDQVIKKLCDVLKEEGLLVSNDTEK